MRLPERTRQEIDPVGTFSSRGITITAAMVGFLFAAILLVLGLYAVVDAVLAVAALAAIGVAAVIVTSATNPYGSPFHRVRHGWVAGLCILAHALLAAASWGEPDGSSLGWIAPVALGLFTIGIAPYRPKHEVLGQMVLAAVLISFVTILRYSAVPSETIPVAALVGMQLLPLVGFSLSAVGFVDSLIDSAESWRRAATEAVGRMSEQQHDGIARSVQQDRVTILNREVVPFFTEVLDSGRLTPDVQHRAQQIADAIRNVMVAEVDRTWLENLIDHLRTRARQHGETPPTHRVIVDESHIANLMSYDQRTALRAFLVAVFDQADDRPRDLQITLVRDGDRYRGTVRVRIELFDAAVKSRFGPYLAVMRVVFRRLRAEYAHSVLTVRFVYDQR